jgi:hypothetical protein
MECLGLHNPTKAEVHPGHKLTGPAEEEGGGGGGGGEEMLSVYYFSKLN